MSSIHNRYTPGTSRIHLISLSCNPLPPTNYGGIETIVTNLAKGLTEKNIPVFCYCPSPMNIPGVLHVETSDRISTPYEDGKFVGVNSREHLDRVADSLKQTYIEGDIVHLHHGDHYPALRKRIADISKYNLVETAHWRFIGLQENIIFPSFSFSAEMNLSGIVINHGIDFSYFDKKTRKTRKENYLFYAGRLTRDKGIHLAVDAAQKMNLEMRIAGPIVDASYADTFMKNVNYIGNLPLSGLSSHYRNALATVYMTQYTEPFGLSPVEAMYCGCPVITTGKGGTGETVLNGKTGFFANNVDDIILATRKIQTINRKDCTDRANYFSIDRMTQGYLNFYKERYG